MAQKTSQPTSLTEEIALHCEQIDTEKAIIRGVKLIGTTSKNRRTYRDSALEAALPLYEGAKVNINHPKGSPLSPRDYQERLGVVKNVQHRPGDGNYGDLHFNPKHPLAEMLLWDAQSQPTNVGFSHNVLARTTKKGDETVVEEITKVVSLDLVADPATTSSLFEQEEPPADDAQRGNQASANVVEAKKAAAKVKANTLDSFAPPMTTLTLEELQAERPDLVEQIQLATISDCIAASEQLLKAGLPPLAIDRALLEAVIGANPETRAALVKARKDLVDSLREAKTPIPQSPRSAPKKADTGPTSAKEFAAAIK